MKILVTGGAGFVGSSLVRRLIKENIKVICVDNLSGNYNPLIKNNITRELRTNKNFIFYKINICNYRKLEKIFIKEKPDKVCHLASEVGVRKSLELPEKYIKVNILGTLNLLKLATKFHLSNFVYSSSSSVYGKNTKLPYSENDKTEAPISPYGATKKSAELMIHAYHEIYNLNCTILRFFTVYGPGGRPDMAPFLFVDAVYKGKYLNKYGNGKTMRDYTYIDDITEGIVKALNKNLSFEIINLGNGHPVTLNKLISLIEKIIGKKALIKKSNQPKCDSPVTYADISKAKRLLEYFPKTSIENGIKNFFNWYVKNEHKLV